MKTVRFNGGSDDLVEVWGIPGEDEYNIISPDRVIGNFELISSEGRMFVRVIYDGTWSFCPGKSDFDDLDEGTEFPNWPIRIGQSDVCQYSLSLEVDVPDDCIVKKLDRK